ncbi:MAG: hypothetical protein ACF788_04105 [Novipirellula sp. JB048]
MSCSPRAALLFLLLLAWVFVGGGTPTLNAQDDPFAGPAGEPVFGAATAPATATTSDPDRSEDPLTAQLKLKARRSDLRFAESISALVRVGRWEDVNTLLGEIAEREIDESVLAAMAARIEPALRLRIVGSEKIDDKARGFIEKLSQAAAAFAESEPRLNKAVDQLDAASVDDRLAAVRTLLQGGDSAIKVLVANVVSASPTAPRDDMLRTMLRLGDGGPQALRQLALYAAPPERLAALRSLVRIDRDAATDELITAGLALDATSEEVDFVRAQLRAASQASLDRSRGIEFLASRLRRYRSIAKSIDNDSQVRMLWSVNPSRDGVEFREVQAMLAAYRDADDAAARLRRIGMLPNSVASEVIAAALDYRVVLDPDWGDEAQLDSFRRDFESTLRGVSLLEVLATTLRAADTPATIGALRLIGSASSPERAVTLLLPAGGQASPLVAAAVAPESRIRYEAATVIADLTAATDLPSVYPDSSRVRKTWFEMASLNRLPEAILVATRADVILAQETILKRLGYTVTVIHSVADAERAVVASRDLRMIVSKTDLVDATPIELIDRVRRQSRGKLVPIVFFGDEINGIASKRWSAPIRSLDQPPSSPLAFAELLDTLQLRRRLPELTPLDRELYRQIGTAALARLRAGR